MSDLIRGRTYEPFFPLIATAFFYHLIIRLVAALLSRVFKALKNRNRKDGRVLKGIKPIARSIGRKDETRFYSFARG